LEGPAWDTFSKQERERREAAIIVFAAGATQLSNVCRAQPAGNRNRNKKPQTHPESIILANGNQGRWFRPFIRILVPTQPSLVLVVNATFSFTQRRKEAYSQESRAFELKPGLDGHHCTDPNSFA
jgi:hypothetical protein